MSRFAPLVLATLALAPLGVEGQAYDPVRDLTAVLDTGRILADRNGDGVLDFLDVRIVLPADAGPAEVAAAADLAARLGYETSATDLGLAEVDDGTRTWDQPVLSLGASNGLLLRAGLDPARLMEELAPGQGALVSLPPGSAVTRGGVAVVGYDATGTLAAGGYLSARYPSVWDLDGISWAELTTRVRAFLEGPAGVAPDEVTLDRIVVERSRPGVSRARISVRLPDAEALLDARAALEGPDTTGPAGGTEEERVSPGADPANVGDGSGAQVGDTLPAAPPALEDLSAEGLHRLDVRLVSPGAEHTVHLRPSRPWEPPEERPYRVEGNDPFSLPRLYSIEGLYRDTNQDLVADELVAYLSLSATEGRGAGRAAGATVDLATRIGLEGAGIRLPIATVVGREDVRQDRGMPVLIGSRHFQIDRLREEGRLHGAAAAPEAGTGFVQLVDHAFDDGGALAVGGDLGGLAAALDWLAGRAPYLWTHGKGEFRLADLETDARRFFQVRSASGQLGLGLAKLRTWMDRDAASGPPPARVEVELAAVAAPEGVSDVASAIVAERFPDTEVRVVPWSTGYGVGDTIFTQDLDLPWEVDAVRELLEGEVYPRLRPRAGSAAPVRIEIRVSEPPEVRKALAEEVRRALRTHGAGEAEVTVLSAYKQGYSWVTESVLPRLRDVPVGRVDITYHTLEESEEVRWQAIAADTRWLQELYPVDAILARELGVADSAVAFHPTRRKDPIYRVTVRDTAGAVVLDDAFDPRYVVRPFFDLFPEYEQVRVTTGWVTAVIGADTLVDRRVRTDPERFWDVLQTDTYRRIIDYVMDTQAGQPAPSNAPYFDELVVRLRMSEPDHRIGVDEEVISALEAIHEDIYFETLTLFDLIGSRYQTSLPYPGRVLPYMDPTGAGEPPTGRITFTGKERGAAELVVRTWADTIGAEPRTRRYPLAPLATPAPRLTGVAVRSGEEGLREVLVQVEARDSVDRYTELAARAGESAIDRQFLSVELLQGMVESLARLRDAGLVEEALSWDRVERLAVRFTLEDDSAWSRVVTLDRSGEPSSTDNPRLFARNWTHGGERLVQWETPIPPSESEEVLAKLATFPGVDVYYLTDSFLGQRVWAADFLPPQPAGYVSQAKLNALKPTLFISGRQHANEVSSTSHILRLGELLVTDSAHRALLNDVNVVLHPIMNPDGARLAVELQETNPDFMLHAGYLGALGVDAAAGERDDDPMYPESQARRRIREAWLPDVYINMHGYPSHEWVQYFAGYSAWVRSRRGGARDWWSPRGWFIPGFSWVDDDEHPDYRTAQFALLDSVAAAITGEPDVEAMNRRLYARYRKYGSEDADGFREHFHDGMLVYLALEGDDDIGSGVYSPRITWFSATTEAPDETARGDWLDVVARAGLAHSTALLRYLAAGRSTVKREAEAWDDGVTRRIFRVKPVLPPATDAPR